MNTTHLEESLSRALLRAGDTGPGWLEQSAEAAAVNAPGLDLRRAIGGLPDAGHYSFWLDDSVPQVHGPLVVQAGEAGRQVFSSRAYLAGPDALEQAALPFATTAWLELVAETDAYAFKSGLPDDVESSTKSVETLSADLLPPGVFAGRYKVHLNGPSLVQVSFEVTLLSAAFADVAAAWTLSKVAIGPESTSWLPYAHWAELVAWRVRDAATGVFQA